MKLGHGAMMRSELGGGELSEPLFPTLKDEDNNSIAYALMEK